MAIGSASKLAWFKIWAIAWAFSNFLSPIKIFFPAPSRRAMAMPICPAPVKSITGFIVFRSFLMSLLCKGGGAVFQPLGDGDLLGAGPLTLAAADTGVGPGPISHRLGIGLATAL